MKTIIACFSRRGENYVSGTITELIKGNGEIIVDIIRQYCDSDIFKIEPVEGYPYDYHQCTARAKFELQKQIYPKITNYIHRFEDYDRVILVYPNWWSTLPMGMFTFLTMHDMKGKQIYPICSHEGSGLGRSVEDIRRLCPDSVVHEGLAVQGSKVNNSQNIIRKYIKEEVMKDEDCGSLC